MIHWETGFEKIGLPRVLHHLKRFQLLVAESKETVFLHGGTLLEAIRDAQLISKDKDLDFGVLDEDALYRLAEQLRPHFTNVFIQGPKCGKTLWVMQAVDDKYMLPFEVQCFYKHCDTWFYNRWLGRSWEYPNGKCVWPERELKICRTAAVNGIEFSVPQFAEDFLSSFYSGNWKVPESYSDWRYNCRNLSVGFLDAEPVIMLVGASRGIGLALTYDLKSEGLLSVCARTVKEETSAKFLARQCDVTKPEQVKAWVQQTTAKFYDVDVLIYNAGLMEFAPLLQASRNAVDAMYEVMVVGYLTVLQAVLPEMLRRKGGYVINISSTRGVSGAPEKGLYSAMKHAATALTETIREEWPSIQATSVHFGMVNTASSQVRYGSAMAQFFPISEDDVVKTVRWLISLSPSARPKSLIVGGRS